MKEENYLEGIYGCLERIEKKVETLPVEGTSPAVGNRTSSPEGIAELKIRLARLSTRRAQENDLLLQENVRTEVKAAYIRFYEAFTICDTQKKSLELAAQNYSVVNNRYLNDLALITDMLDASNSKLNAELQLVNAQINILFNLYKLKKTAGCL